MKRKIIGLFAIILSASLLSACASNVKTIPSESPWASPPATVYYPANASIQPSPSPAPSPSPKVNYTVKTDYSQLTPYEPPEEIYTRLSEDYMPELIPSDDYGMLLPYVGEVLYDNFYGSYSIGSYEGLVTLDGMMVTDTIFSSVQKPSFYDEYSNSYVQKSLYILEKVLNDETNNGDSYPYEMYAICALDGSWITPFEYVDVICCDKVMLMVRDYGTNDFDVMDYNGKILYNTKALNSFAHLGDYIFYCGDGPTPMDYGDGYIALWNWDDNIQCAYMNEMSGELILTEYSSIRCFSEGFAAVEKNGLWGYIDSSFSLVITPVYDYAYSFIDGKAIVLLPTGENAIIDTSGNILLSTKRDIQRDDGYFEVGYENSRHTIYDSSINELFNTNTVDSWGNLSNGYFYVKDEITTVLFNNTEITIPGKNYVYDIIDNYIFYHIEGTRKFILATLQGQPTAELSKPYLLDSIVHTLDGTDCYIFSDSDYDQFFVISHTGKSILEGYMNVNKVADTALIRVSDDEFFGFIDTSGRYIFRISLQDSIPD